eukprot:3264733-Amphidinium_carterae.2
MIYPGHLDHEPRSTIRALSVNVENEMFLHTLGVGLQCCGFSVGCNLDSLVPSLTMLIAA